jgi:hypothetical protein
MVAVPADIPVTTPVVAPMVAIAGLLLLQVAPTVVVLNVVVLPTHTLVVPVIGPGNGLTVTVAVVMQPDGERL